MRVRFTVVVCAAFITLGCSRQEKRAQTHQPSASAEDPTKRLAVDYSDARALFALASQETKSPAERAALLEQIVRNYPNSETYKEALYALAQNYQFQNRDFDALATFSKYASLFPDGPEAIYALKYAVAYSEMKVDQAPASEKQKAEEARRAALSHAVDALSPITQRRTASEEPLVWGTLAEYRARLGETDEVIRLTSQLIAAFPRFEGDERGRYVAASIPAALNLRADALVRRFERSREKSDLELAIQDLTTYAEFVKAGPRTDVKSSKVISDAEQRISHLRAKL